MAHFSPFHFHRVYSSIAGETVAATVRRVRLALATRLLESGEESITQVALAVGYDSPQAFTRAFGQFTGQSPRAFQQQMRRAILHAGVSGDTIETGAAPTVRIIERPAQRVFALRHQGPLSTIPHTQRRLRLLAGQSNVSAWLGASFGDPDQSADFSYYAAAASPEPWPANAQIEMLDIPAGRYALHCLADEDRLHRHTQRHRGIGVVPFVGPCSAQLPRRLAGARARTNRVRRGGGKKLALHRWMRLGLFGGEPYRAAPHSLRTERHRGCHLSATADAACTEHGNRGDGVDDFGDEDHRADLTRMAAGLGTLSDDDVDPGVDMPLGVLCLTCERTHKATLLLHTLDHVLGRWPESINHQRRTVATAKLAVS